jgi:hypothetical protein
MAIRPSGNWGGVDPNAYGKAKTRYDNQTRYDEQTKRYNEQKAWQDKVRGWKELEYDRNETAILKNKASNLALNEVSSLFLKDPWEKGYYEGAGLDADGNPTDIPESKELLNSYLLKMKEAGHEMNPQEIQSIHQYIQGSRQNFISDASKKLRARMSEWDLDAKGKYGSDDWVPFNDETEEMRKKYLKAIGGSELYSQLVGEGGGVHATEQTGLTPDNFTKSSFGEDFPWKTTAAGLGGVYWGSTAASGQYKEATKLFTETLKKDLVTAGKNSTGLTASAFKDKYGIIKKNAIGKNSDDILKMARQAGWRGTWFNKLSRNYPKIYSMLKMGAPEIGKKADEILGTGDVLQTGGTAAMLHETQKQFSKVLFNSNAKKGFWAFLKKKLPAAMAKQGASALARHGTTAATGVGAAPPAQIFMLLVDAGFSIYAIYDLIQEYQREG